MDKNVPVEVFKELETEIRRALSADDDDAVEDLLVEMKDIGILITDLPPDLQAQLAKYDKEDT